MAEDFKLLLQAAVDLQKSQNNINKQIEKLKAESIKVGIEVDTKTAKQAIQKLAKSQEEAFKLSSGKTQLNNSITAYIKNNTKASSEYVTKLKEIQTQIKNTDKSGLGRLRQEFKNTSSEIKSLGQTGDSTFTRLNKNIGNFLGFLTSATIIMQGIRTIQNMVSEVKNLDDALLELSKVSDLTKSQLEDFVAVAYKLSEPLGKTGTDFINAVATFKRASYDLDESIELAQDALKLTNVAEGIKDTGESADILTRILKGFNLEASESGKILDIINQVSNTQAINFDSLADAYVRVSAVANQAGASIEETSGLITGAFEILGNSEKVSSGLITIFTRLQSIQMEGEETVSTVSKLQDQFSGATKGLVNIVDGTSGQLRDVFDILSDLNGVWDTLDKNTQEALAFEAAGTRQKAVFLSLMQNWESVESSIKSATNSIGSADVENSKYLDSLSGRLELFASSFQKLSSTVADSDMLKTIVSGGAGAIDVINGLINTFGGFTPVVITTGVAIATTKIAMDALITSTEKKTISTLAATVAEYGLGTSIKATGSAIKTFLMTNPVGWLITLGTAIAGVVVAVDLLTTSIEEQKEKLEESKTAYAESKTELESINSELATTIARMKELNEKENLTFVEESELEKLKEVNKTLLIQQDILKKQNELKAREVASTTLDTFNKVYGGSNISQSQVSEYVDTANSSGNNAILASDENNISSLIAAYQQFNKLKEEAYSAENNDDIQFYSELLDEISSSLYTNIDNLNSYKSTLESIPYEQLTQEQKSALEEIGNAIGLIYTNISPEDWKQIQFEDIISTEGVDEAISKVKELADTQPITKEQIENSKALMDAIGATGLTAEDVAKQLNALSSSSDSVSDTIDTTTESVYALAEASKEATGYVNDLGENVSVDKLQSAINDSQTSVQDFKEILKSMDDNNGLTLDGLQKITQKYPQLLSYVGDEKQLREQLKKGIEDQNKTAEQYYKNVLELDTNFFNTIIDNNSKLVNKLSEYYGVDIKNFQSLANAKNETEITLLNSLTKKWGEYYKAQEAAAKIAQASATTQTNIAGSGLFLGDGGFGDLAIENANKMTEERRKAAETESKMYSQIKDLFVNTDYTGDLVSGLSGLTNPDTSKTKKTFSEVFDWISIRIEKLQKKAQKTVDSISKYISYKTKNSRIDIAVNTKINEKTSLESIQKSYEKLAKDVKLPKKYMDLVNNGGMNVETITDEKLAVKIKEYQKWNDAASSVADQIEDITEEIKVLNSQKLDVISAYFGDRTDYIGSKISRRESYISNKEASGKKVTESDYNYLIQLQNDIISNTKKELDAFSSVFNQQVKDGIIKKGTAEYYEGLKTINGLTIQSREAQSAIYDLNTEIRSVRWDSFDKGVTSINNVKDELNDLASMIDNEDAIGEGGIFTSEGITKVGLYAQQLQENNKLISEYQVAINSLGKELKKGVITQEQYDEELVKYQKLQRQAVLDNKSLEKSIADLAKERIQSEIKALEEQTEAFKKSTDAQKDALQAQKDLYEYQKLIDKKNSNINVLQKQIAALSLSDDRKDIAQRLKLEKELKEKQAELEEEQTKHSIDAQLDSYDNDYDNYKSSQDSKVKTLEKSLEDQETLVKNALDEAFKNTQIISTGIQTLASEHGINVTTSVVSPWQSATSALEVYKQALSTLPSSTSINTNSITAPLNIGAGASAGVGTGATKTSTPSTSSQSSTTKSNTSSNSGMVSSLSGNIQFGHSGNNVSKLQTALKALGYNIGSAGVDGKFGDKTLSAVRQFQSDNSIAVDGVVGDKTKAKFKLKGYKDGIAKILEDQLAWTQENGDELIVKPSSNSILTPLSAGDGVIKADLTKNLMDWGKFNPSNMATLSGITSLTGSKGSQPISIKYDNLITVNGNLDKSVDIEGIVNRAIDKQQSNLITLMKQYK